MNKKEMFEWIKTHFPDLNEIRIQKLLNMAMDDFCEKTEILKDIITIEGSSVANQRYYPIEDKVLKIKELRINEQVIPRLQDTGIIDSTIVKGELDTDTGADGTGNDGLEPDVPGPQDLDDGPPPAPPEKAVYFNNEAFSVSPEHTQYVPNNNIQYIEIPKTALDEVKNTRNMTISVWVKFDNKLYSGPGYIFNNSGLTPNNGALSLCFNQQALYENFWINNDSWIALRTSLMRRYKENSFIADVNVTNTDEIHPFQNFVLPTVGQQTTVGKAGYRIAQDNYEFGGGVISSDNPGIGGDLDVRNKWHLLTFSFNGNSAADGGGSQLFVSREGLAEPNFAGFGWETNNGIPTNTEDNPWYNRDNPQWRRANGPTITQGNLQPYLTSNTYDNPPSDESHTQSQNIQLGCYKYTSNKIPNYQDMRDGITDINMAMVPEYNYSEQFDVGLPNALYQSGCLVFPFSGYMRNLIISNNSLTKENHISLFNEGIASLEKAKEIIGSDNIKHFYSLESDANDSVGSVNGTTFNDVQFVRTNLPSKNL